MRFGGEGQREGVCHDYHGLPAFETISEPRPYRGISARVSRSAGVSPVLLAQTRPEERAGIKPAPTEGILARISCSAGVSPVLLAQTRPEERAGIKPAPTEGILARISCSAGVSPVLLAQTRPEERAGIKPAPTKGSWREFLVAPASRRYSWLKPALKRGRA